MTAFLGVPVPQWESAACLNRYELFDFVMDDGNPAADARALRVCASCAELVQCGEWVDSLPAGHRPIGVVAGRVHRPARTPEKETKWKEAM